MKKICAILLSVGLMAAAVQAADQATSVNVVGFVNQTVLPAGKLVLLGVPFVNIGTNTTTLEGILGTNQLRSASFYTLADRVLLWNGLSYSFYAINSTDGKFHNAQSFATWGQAATNPIVRPGDGIWIWAPASAVGTNTISMVGEVVSSSNSSVNISYGMNLLSHQFSCGLDVNNSSLTNSEVLGAAFYTTADQIYVWDSSKQTYHKWAMNQSDRKWHYADSFAQWGTGPVTNLINAGDGFWYRRLTNSVLNWTESSPYYNNLH